MSLSFERLASARRNVLAICLLVSLTGAASAAPPHDAGAKHAREGGAARWLKGARQPDRFRAALNAKVRTFATPGVNIPVTTCADDGSDGTLRKAIEGASDGDTIDMSGLQCSLITLQSGQLLSAVPHLSIKGPGANALTIDGSNSDRIIKGAALDISDVTIAHGLELSEYGGGCVFATDGLSLTRATLSACLTISGTSSAPGGAAMVVGTLTMRDSVIFGSTAAGYTTAGGGGAFVYGNASLYGSTISGNSAQATQDTALGGGLLAFGEVELHGSTINWNTATSVGGRAYGGGVHAQDGSHLNVLDSSTISGNTAHSDSQNVYGGGINSGTYPYVATTTLQIDHSSVSGNTAESDCALCFVGGGGAHVFDSIVAAYATFNNNYAVCTNGTSNCAAGGGGLASFGSQPTSTISVRNTTISQNGAVAGNQAGGSGFGGGVMAGAGTPFNAENSTIAFNVASHEGGGIVVDSPVNAASVMNSTIVANNVTDNGPNDIAPGPFGISATINGEHNLVMTATATVTLPLDTLTDDPLLLPLDSAQGGTTAVHPLAANSPAIDAGNNIDLLGCDQRGYPYRRVQGIAADIGAYEAQGEPHLFADNFDGSVTCPPAAP